MQEQFDLYGSKTLTISAKKLYQRDEKRSILRKLRYGKTRNGEVSLSGRTIFK